MRDLIGKVFNRWTVLSFSHKQNSDDYWVCLCQCGGKKTIFGGSLVRGLSKSCGCLKRDIAAERSKNFVDTDLVKKLYEEGKTHQEIADMLKVDRTLIGKRLQKMNVAPRKFNPVMFGQENPMWKGGKVDDGYGYIQISVPNHPRANGKCSYVLEHIIIMESHIGRHLKWISAGHGDNEVVHHINRNKKDNRIENLQLMTHREHMALHGKVNIKNIYGS